MADNFLRQSQLIGSFGPGSFVDLPERSVIICGLSEWDRQGGFEIHEPRLLSKLSKALGVTDLKLFTPPPFDDVPGAPRVGVSARVFPTWFVGQDRMPNSGSFGKRRLVGISATEKNGLYYRDPDDGKRKQITPTRFVCACRRGHTDDVDWRSFVHRSKTNCQRTLWIEEQGTSGEVADTWVGCDCGQQRQLYDALDLNTFALGRCNGKRPWLGQFAREDCSEPNRLLVRSASNAYFAEIMSVISLPDQHTGVTTRFDEIWDLVKDVGSVDELRLLRKIQAPVRAALEGLSDEEAMSIIWRRNTGADDERPVKEAEFDTLASGNQIMGQDVFDSRFYAQTLERAKWDNGDALLTSVQNLVLIHRLREVIAQVGFTRFEPPAPDVDGDLDMDVQRQLLDVDVRWLPAIEHRGEGIFIHFASAAVNSWLKRPAVADRVGRLRLGFDLWKADRRSERNFPGGPYIMLHSLSHLLLSTIALYSGYPASSLRERVYAFRDRYGILIHTGTSDSEGTLGGLVESGRSIGAHLREALILGRLCSNDPVCADHAAEDRYERRFLQGAACHGCLLIAETSCEQRNDLLDRALVVPTVATPGAAFFEGANDL